MKRIAILLIASAAVCSAPALAEDVVIKKSSPSVDVTVGSGSDRVVREKEVVIDKREPRIVSNGLSNELYEYVGPTDDIVNV